MQVVSIIHYFRDPYYLRDDLYYHPRDDPYDRYPPIDPYDRYPPPRPYPRDYPPPPPPSRRDRLVTIVQ